MKNKVKDSILLSVCDLPKEDIKNLGLSYRDIGIRCNNIIKKYSLKDLKNEDIIKNQKKLRRELSNWVNNPVNLLNSQGNYIGDKFGARITICLADGLVIHDVETFCRDVKNKNNRVLGKNNNFIFLKNDTVSLDLTNQEFIYSTLNTTTLNTNPFNSNIKYTNLHAYKVKSSTLPSSNTNSDLIQYSSNDTSDGDDIDIVSGERMDLRTTRKEFIQATVRRYGYASRVSKQIVTTNPIVTTNHHVCKDVEGENEIYCRLSYFEFPAPTIIDVAVADGRFKTLFSAVKAAGLVEALSGPGPFTVFAPTDDAFKSFTPGALQALLADGPQLQKLLQYHVVAGKVMAADVVNLSFAKTLADGLNVSIRVENGKVFVNDSQVIITDIPCANGVIHVIDAVLSPLTTTYDLLIKSKKFTTLVAALNAAGLATTLSGTDPDPITVFAPTDAAFAKLLPAGTVADLLKPENLVKLQELLQYHVVAGKVMAADVVKLTFAKTLAGGLNVSIRVENGKVFVNDSQVIITDVVGSNGIVIHVIDTVLSPQTTYDLLIKSNKFNALVAALNAADLATVLSGSGPITVFAPTDDAFNSFTPGALEALLADGPQLLEVLKYHAVADKVMAADIINAIADGSVSTYLTTLAGPSISVKIKNGDVILNDSAKVTITDVLGSNDGGVVVHVINTVLSPQTIEQLLKADQQFVSLVAALDAAAEGRAGIEFAETVAALSGSAPVTLFAVTNKALAKVSSEQFAYLTAEDNRAELQMLVEHHVSMGSIPLVADSFFEMKNGLTAYLDKNGDKWVVNGVNANKRIVASNGAAIHPVDNILNLQSVPDMVKHIDALNEVDKLLDRLPDNSEVKGALDAENVTLLAPLNSGVTEVLDGITEPLGAEQVESVLKKHIVAGDEDGSLEKADLDALASANNSDQTLNIAGSELVFTKTAAGVLKVNGTKFKKHDIKCKNGGTIHTVEKVLA